MKIIKTGQDARDALKTGIDLVANCVKVTLGPSGRNAVLGRLNITPIVTNDGVTIARNIEAEDEFQDLGVKIVQEASSLTDNSVGDGTTTTTILLQSIVDHLFEQIKDDGSLVKKNVDAIKLKKELDIWCEKVVEELKKKSRPLTKKDIYNVALVSAEYEWLAKIITEVYEKVGKDGYVSVEEGLKTEYEVFKGIELGVGYNSDYFINNDKRQCVIEKPRVFVTNQRIDTNSIGPVAKLIESLALQGVKELIIIAPEFSRDVYSRFNTTKVKAGFSVVALALPTFDKNDVLLDIAALTGATFVDRNTFSTFELFSNELSVKNIGVGERAIIEEGKSFIMGEGDTKERIKDIKKIKEKTESIFDRDTLDKRMAYLSGGIATIKIGGESEFEKGYFKLKAEDAVNAVQVAFQDGVIKGGGVALKEVSEEMPVNILTSSLVVPYNQIQKNSGGYLEIKESVIDPVKVTISALKSAVSLAGMVLTTEVLIAHKHEFKDKNEN